ncbi:MAG: MarR family transcriptional regulator [Candidatus Omnitrophica bacterium]|nr:MarR family transcriptional regulator [Candidatus Omnitrophota bacterium]
MSIFREMGVKETGDKMSEKVVYSIAKAYGVIERTVSDALHMFGLSAGKFNILMTVKHVGRAEGIAQNGISKHLLVTTSNMTRMLDKLEKEGLVERRALPGDRRVNKVFITKKGSELLDNAWPSYKKTVDELVDSAYSLRNKVEIAGLLGQLKKGA